MVLSFLGRASVRTPFVNQADDVQVLFCWHQRSQQPSWWNSASSPISHQSSNCCSWTCRTNYKAHPKIGVCLNSGLYQPWRSKRDLQAERSEPEIAVYCHIKYSLREGPRLRQLQEELSYSVRALLDIYRYWWSIIASFASLFSAHFPSPNNILCLCSWLSASVCCTPLNIFNFVPVQNINKSVEYRK